MVKQGLFFASLVGFGKGNQQFKGASGKGQARSRDRQAKATKTNSRRELAQKAGHFGAGGNSQRKKLDGQFSISMMLVPLSFGLGAV
jgi:hypothetical protein